MSAEASNEPGVKGLTTELLRYLAVSMVALAVDMGSLLLAAQFMHYLWAASIGFFLGAITSYLLAVRWAFRHRRFATRPRAEFAAYVMVGIMGLGINNLVIYACVEYLQLVLPLAKAGAAGVTFVFNFGIRKWGLFRPDAL